MPLLIFVCVGSRPYQFNRLFEELDRLVGAGCVKESVFAQIGASTYEPTHFAFEHFMDPDAFKAKMAEADIVISHGASGSIMGALSAGKRVIAVSRLAKYGEHINKMASVYLTAVIEYLVAEVLELAGGQAKDFNKNRITPRHIQLAVRSDPELNELLKDVTICNGGVCPNIPTALQKKATKKPATSQAI